jgi:hypothetical protein
MLGPPSLPGLSHAAQLRALCDGYGILSIFEPEQDEWHRMNGKTLRLFGFDSRLYPAATLQKMPVEWKERLIVAYVEFFKRKDPNTNVLRLDQATKTERGVGELIGWPDLCTTIDDA